jgi:hypothetical protein
LTDELGFIPSRQYGSRFRYEIPTAVVVVVVAQEEEEEKETRGANIVDVLCLPYTQKAVIGIGSVHHVAWRTPTDEQQKVLRMQEERQLAKGKTLPFTLLLLHGTYFMKLKNEEDLIART